MFFFFSYLNEQYQDKINEINELIINLEKQLTISTLNENYPTIMILGRKVCERMAEFLLKNEIPDFNSLNEFFENITILYEKNIIPKECNDFLHIIRINANRVIHGDNISNKLIYSFLKALNYFIRWFDNYCIENYIIKFQIEEFCEIINKLEYDERKDTINVIYTLENIKLTIQQNPIEINQEISELHNEITNKKLLLEKERDSLDSSLKDVEIYKNKEEILNKEIERLKEELKSKEDTYQNQIEELNKQNNEILKKLDEYGKLFGKCMDIMVESNERGKRVESKIDDLHTKIDNISNQIKIIQSFTERQIKTAQSTEEIERIIETYINECIDNIMSFSQIFTENQNYEIEKQKLIYSIGENSWNKLCEKSKTFLITSKVMYNHLITMDEIIDYSGICVLVTKALEVEMHKRFFMNFLEFLNEKYGNDYKKYHTALLYKYKKPLLSEKFTMGNIAFVMCYIENRHDKLKQKINNKIVLMEYCKKYVFSNYTSDEIEELLTKYASSIEEIREKFRNPSAHTNEIRRTDAEECFNLILDVEKLLKKMLDSFDY